MHSKHTFVFLKYLLDLLSIDHDLLLVVSTVFLWVTEGDRVSL